LRTATGLRVLKALATEASPPAGSLAEVQLDNDFERKLLGDVTPPHEVGVSFSDVGALESVKVMLREVVMLPLQRPELFTRGALAKPTKGLLLFGPPGEGAWPGPAAARLLHGCFLNGAGLLQLPAGTCGRAI
jgi:SpoVK/Ycf46/Vps4 family AAA+-type ATPase